MQSRIPKNTDQYYWTEHVKFKMRFYGLSAQKVLSVIKNPERREVGIVKNTVAVMCPSPAKATASKPAGTTKNRYEIWVMMQNHITRNTKHVTKRQTKIISAWKYPGVSPKNKPIPEEILRDIEEYLK